MKEMTITDHLEELRKHIIRIIIILGAGFALSYAYSDQVSRILLLPLQNALNPQDKIIFLGILDKMMVQFQIAFWGGVLFTSPFWFREVWLFVKPALHSHEIKIIRPFMIVGFFLFISGVLFGYYIAFPLLFKILLQTGLTEVTASLNLRDYISLVLRTLVVLGLLFQLPNLIVILGFMGLVTKYSLRKMRGMIYVGLSVFAAIITPPDVITMIGVLVPLIFLFEAGILILAWVVHPYLEKKNS